MVKQEVRLSGLGVYGLRRARKIIRDTRKQMKGQSGDYVRGWRAALEQVDDLIGININDELSQKLTSQEPTQ